MTILDPPPLRESIDDLKRKNVVSVFLSFTEAKGMKNKNKLFFRKLRLRLRLGLGLELELGLGLGSGLKWG